MIAFVCTPGPYAQTIMCGLWTTQTAWTLLSNTAHKYYNIITAAGNHNWPNCKLWDNFHLALDTTKTPHTTQCKTPPTIPLAPLNIPRQSISL